MRAFGAAAELGGFREAEVEIPPGTDLEGLKTELGRVFPGLSPILPHLRLAVGRGAGGMGPLREGDEVALLPPVSGGESGGGEGGVKLSVRVLPGPLPVGEALSFLLRPDCGGVAIFLGVAREESGGRKVRSLEYDAYPEMAEATLKEIASEAAGRGARSLLVWHRTGLVERGEPSVVVGASAPHRAEAFEACRYLIEELKKRAPIWKKEIFEDGSAWVGLPPL